MDQRRRNIERFRETLTSSPYRGYDVVIVSSSTEEEAAYQQDLLEAVLGPLRTDCEPLGGRVLVLSVVDPTEGGQMIGQVRTWREARSAARTAGHDLDALLCRGPARIAIYHNGGKGERASPLTQGLGNSRGAQKLVGSVPGADGRPIDLELLLSVVLQTSSLAASQEGRSVDTFWTSQLLFDSRSPDDLVRSGMALEKFIVTVDRDRVTARELHDYGTALLHPDGRIARFFGNKQFGHRLEDGSWQVVEERRGEWDVEELEFGFDFGSYRARADLHLDLIEFHDRPELWQSADAKGRVPKSESRDIDPHFTQPLVALLDGVARIDVPGSLPPAEDLRQRVAAARDRGAREQALGPASRVLREALDPRGREALDRARPEGARDAVEFWLLHRDRPYLADPRRVVGSIRFGAQSYWLSYRRPIDIANEKLLMLADLAGGQPWLAPDGALSIEPAGAAERRRAADLRFLRGIAEDSVARFRVGGREVALGASDVAHGVEVDGVYVRGSVIAGNVTLLSGSRIVDSVVHHSSGRIAAEGSWVEGVTAPEVEARSSLLHKVVSSSTVAAEGEVVSDAFRPELRDEGFPPGQVRLRVPIGYDPQAPVECEGGERRRRDEVQRTEGGGYTFAEVRAATCRRRADAEIEAALRAAVEREAITGEA